jgi:hypothetical protein
MAEKSHISIRNGIIASLIAAAILTFVEPLRDYSIRFFLWLWSGVTWVLEAFIDSYSMPGWAWLIVFIFALIGVLLIIQGARPEEKPEYSEYTEDRIYGAIWRWHWVGNTISHLWCFCSKCDATLVYTNPSVLDYSTDAKTDFMCENCGTVEATIKGGDKGYAIGAIEREISRRVRTNQYKQH